MTSEPDFLIKDSGRISNEFIYRNILTFKQATSYVRQLPYGRNIDKDNPTSLFTENCGTCSTKHALLKLLAIENDFEDIHLIIGIFKMNGTNTPEVLKTLQSNNLDYIPEAHCYLRYKDIILDFTKKNLKPSDYTDDLIEEIEIHPNQITTFKMEYHVNYLKSWLENNRQISFNIDEIWQIREHCIQNLTD